MEEETKSYLPLILDRLKHFGIYKVILFGSMSTGEIHLDSDIDLIVVTNDDHFPESYKEKSDV